MDASDVKVLEEKIAAFHAHESTFDKAIEASANSMQVTAWFEKQRELKEDAGKEFARLTADRNSSDCYKIVKIPFMESFVEKVKSGKFV